MNFFRLHLALKMSYIIKCYNCYFDMYLYEINQNPAIMDPKSIKYTKHYAHKKKRGKKEFEKRFT